MVAPRWRNQEKDPDIMAAGCFEDGRLADMFLTVAEAARDAPITASLQFQHGGSVETLRHAITRKSDGSAAGPLAAVLDIPARETGNTP
jgi:hypothetical protein